MSGNGLLVLAYVHPGEVDGLFHQSVVQLLMADHKRKTPRILVGGGVVGLSSGPRIATARNELVQHFLKMPSQPEWLLMVDADMVFAPTMVDKLLEAADPKERPIVGGLCFGGGKSGRLFPTLYRLRKGTDQNPSPIEVIEQYPDDAVCKVDATGAAFLLMHRDTLVAMGERYRGTSPWFSEGTEYKGLSFGEDWAFCMRAKAMEIQVFVHTGVKIGHVKPQILDEHAHRAYLDLRDQIGDGGILQRHAWSLEGRDAVQAPNFVVIPFKGKLEMTGSLVWQLVEQGDVERILLFNNGEPLTEEEEKELLMDDRVELYDAADMTIHQMWNDGIVRIQEVTGKGPANIAFVNNDIILQSTGVLTKLAKALRADGSLAAICPRYDDRDARGVEMVEGVAGAVGGLAGFFFMVKGEMFHSSCMPMFDEKLRWWFGEADMLLTAARLGFRAAVFHGARIEHIDGGSVTAKETPGLKELVDADRAYFNKKWGFD